MFGHKNKEDELEEIEKDLREQNEILRDIRDELKPKLSFIKIRIGGQMPEGPVTLTVGQKTVASVDGFDQNGVPWTGTLPQPSWGIDNASFATIATNSTTPTNEDVTAVGAGVANLSVSLTSAEGKALTDTEQVIVQAQKPVLSSIKINFAPPA